MRVTNQQIMKQMLSDVKKLESQSVKGLAKGQVFKAVIREVMSDSLLLELKSGELLRSNLPQGEILASGSQHSFEVLENEKQLVVKLFSDETMESLEKTLEGLFKGSGEKVTPEKLGAAKALLSFGQPISRESVNELVNTSKQVDTFKGLIESNLIKLSDIPPRSPVKQILIAHYSNEQTNQPQNESDIQRLMETSVKSRGDVNTETLNSEKSVDNLGLNQTGVNANTSESSGEVLDGLRTEGKEDQFSEGLKGKDAGKVQAGDSSKSEAADKLLELLKNVDFQKLAFHKSANIGNSVQSLAMLDKLLFGKDTIGNQLTALIETLNESPNKIPADVKTLLESLDGLGLKDEEKLDEVLSKVIQGLEQAEDKSESNIGQMKSQLTNIQQSLDYMKTMNESISYFQLPLQVDNELRSVDFFVKKRKINQKSEDETTIFISLDTHNLDTVQVLLEYKRQNVGIQFRLSDQDVLELMESNQAVLDEQLEGITEKKFDVHFRLKDKLQTNLDVIAEISSTSSATIDVKV